MQIDSSSSRRRPVCQALPVIVVLALVGVFLAAPALAGAAPAATKLTIRTTGHIKVVPYHQPASFLGELTLDDAALTPLSGYAVAFERSFDQARWTFIQDVPYEDVPSYSWSYAVQFIPTRATFFRFRFAGDSPVYAASVSSAVKVTPMVWLTTPTAPKVVRDNTSFSASGYLKPRHASGAMYVKIRCYRRSSTGLWVLKRVAWATDYIYRDYTRYKARVALPSAGTWKLVAFYVGTSKYARTTSGVRYLRVTN
jgi:hypothetical protein